MNKTTLRALLARPLVFSAGTVAAALINPSLQTGGWLFWILGIFGGTNLALFAFWWLRDGRGSSAALASPVINLVGWGVLATLTGGLESPFVAAIFFEIALAVVSLEPRGVLWVTANGAVLLVLVEALYRFAHVWLLILEVLFVLAIGGLGAGMSGRRRAGELAFRAQGQELGSRLDSLQRELEDERVISRVGENVARLAHGLKNAVHSLRGFVALIEPRLERGAGTNAALAGLRAAIDDLEKLARMTLAEGGPAVEADDVAAPRDATDVVAVAEIVEQARRELSAASPNVSWSVDGDSGGGDLFVGLRETTLLELLVILMRNAVEAMEGRGHGTIDFGRRGEYCRLTVRDEGKGLSSEDLAKIFQPGFTTKNRGSGFGLFLARRIVEDHGGSLDFSAGEQKGAVVRVELPLVRVEEAG